MGIKTVQISKQPDFYQTSQVFKLIRQHFNSFTPAQKALAEYILHNAESLLFMSTAALAGASKVSQATVIRFCNTLGFDGYTQLTSELKQSIQGQLSAVGRFHLKSDPPDPKESYNGDQQRNSVLERVLTHEIKNLSSLAESIKVQDFGQAVSLISRSHQVAIIGCMASSSLSTHMGYMLGKVKTGVSALSSEGLAQTNTLARLNKDALVIVIAYPRYPSATMRMAKEALKSNCSMIAITDSHLSPVSGLGDITFHIPAGLISFIDAFAAPLTFINALCIQVAENDPEKTAHALGEFDRFTAGTSTFVTKMWRGRPRKK